MPNLVPIRDALPTRLGSGLSRRTARALEAIEHRTLTRMANVQAEGYVQAEKLHEIDSLTREAMSGQAMLHKWQQTLSQGDPFVLDDLRFYMEVAKVGKGEVIADTIDSYCRESRQPW